MKGSKDLRVKCIGCRSWNCFNKRRWHHSDKCESIVVYRSDTSCQFHSRLLHRHFDVDLD